MIKNKMSKAAYERLLEKKEETLKKLRKAQRQLGETRGSWGGSFFKEQVRQEFDLYTLGLKEIEKKLESVEIIEEGFISDTVGIGSRAQIEIGGEKEEYTILGEADSSPTDHIISEKSPLAKALFGKKVGDEFEFEVPDGVKRVKVLKIS